jgi:hypothetical protein
MIPAGKNETKDRRAIDTFPKSIPQKVLSIQVVWQLSKCNTCKPSAEMEIFCKLSDINFPSKINGFQ